jgi:PST family polysaccharide transporter
VLLQLAGGAVLARLLTPSDFGVLGAVLVITGFAELLTELGLSSALVQQRDPDEHDRSTAFWVNALMGLVLTLAVGLTAPLTADLFELPALRQLLWLLALPFALSLSVVHRAQLERDLRFRRLAGIDLVSSTAGMVASIVAAVLGAGVYALALGPITQALLANALSWQATPWRPHHGIDRSAVRRLWSFTGSLLAFNLVNYWARNADNLVVARAAGPAALGFYNRAYRIMLLPVNEVGGTAGRVLLPALSSFGGDLARVRAGYRDALRVMCALTFPAIAVLAVSADAFVVTLWGAQWSTTGPLLTVLALSAFPQVLMSSTGALYQSQARTDLMFRNGAISAVLTVGAFVLGSPWGATGVATAWCLRCWLVLPWTVHRATRLVGLRWRTVAQDVRPTAVAVAFAATVGLAVRLLVSGLPAPLRLLVETLVVAGAYAAALRPLAPGTWQAVTELIARRTVTL